jgi:hypothetical protein
MAPPNLGSSGQYIRVTRQGQRRKETIQPMTIVKLEDVTTSELKSSIPTRVEEELPTLQQGEVQKSSGDGNGVSNPNPEEITRPTDTEEPRPSQSREEVLVEDITDRPDSPRDEENAEVTKVGTSTMGKKIRPPRVYIFLYHSFQT